MRLSTFVLRLVIFAALASRGQISSEALASTQDVAAFYKGKTIDFYVGSSVGDGYDNYGRLLAQHIGRYIPGQPSVVVSNMPTASGLAEANYLYNEAPRNGTAFGIMMNNMTVEPLMGNTNARFNPSKFNWIGSADKLVNVCVAWHTVPVRTIQDLRTHEWLVGATAARSSTVQEANVFIALGGARLKVVAGYPSTTSMLLALERGELQIACGIGWDSIKSSTNFLQEGKIIPVMQLGYKADPELAGVPFIYDMLVDQSKKPELDFITERLNIGRAYAAPPGVPAERLQALRNAFWSAMHDPKVLAEAQNQRMMLSPTPGAEVQKEVTELAATPKDVIAASNDIVENNISLLQQAHLNWIDVRGTRLTGVADGGRTISFLDQGRQARAATESAKLTIDGKRAAPSDLKADLTCDISYLGNGDAARTIECRRSE